MSSASPSFILPSETDVLLASPPIGPAVCTASLRLPITASPAGPVSPVRSLPLPFEAPFTVQISPVHSSIEILPPPPRSSVAVTTAPLTCAPSLTERALRFQRRDALRALHDVAVTSSPPPVRLRDTLLADSGFGAQTGNSHMQPHTPRQQTPVHNYSSSAPAPRATTHAANHPPSTVFPAPRRALSPLAPLRASSSTMPSITTSATAPSKMSSAASPARSAPLPHLDFSPPPSPDMRANTGSRTGRTPGLRPAAPLQRAFPLAIPGPPPHWASVWDTLTPQQRADVGQASLHEVKEGLSHTRVSAETSAATDPDRHEIDLGTAEHERVPAPLISKLSVLHGHRATAHTELLECQVRVTAIEAQERSTAAALTAEKRRHASFLSGLSGHPPA